MKLSASQRVEHKFKANPRAMVVQHNVKGYDEFSKLVDELEGSGEPIHVLFSGGKNEKGESWCPYCVKGN